MARRESDEGVCFVYVFGVHGEIVYLTADNRQGLATAFSAKPYQSYVMVRKALFMSRNEPRGSKPQFFCSVHDTQSELNSELAGFLSRKFSGIFTKACVLLAVTKEQAWDIVVQCFSTFVRPRPGKFFFYKTRARSQQIYS